MLIRNATLWQGTVLQPGMELRLMHGVVQEMGVGLVKGLYESEMDLQGDVLRPGRAVICEQLTAAELRRLHRQGIAVVITKAAPDGCIRWTSPRIILMNPLPAEIPEEYAMQAGIRPGSPAPLTRWSRDGRFLGVIHEHSGD